MPMPFLVLLFGMDPPAVRLVLSFVAVCLQQCSRADMMSSRRRQARKMNLRIRSYRLSMGGEGVLDSKYPWYKPAKKSQPSPAFVDIMRGNDLLLARSTRTVPSGKQNSSTFKTYRRLELSSMARLFLKEGARE